MKKALRKYDITTQLFLEIMQTTVP